MITNKFLEEYEKEFIKNKEDPSKKFNNGKYIIRSSNAYKLLINLGFDEETLSFIKAGEIIKNSMKRLDSTDKIILEGILFRNETTIVIAKKININCKKLRDILQKGINKKVKEEVKRSREIYNQYENNK